jgi:hypothetical protein
MGSSKVWIAVFLVGMVIGVQVASRAGAWAATDVLAPVVVLGLALPAGWMGYDAIRRR